MAGLDWKHKKKRLQILFSRLFFLLNIPTNIKAERRNFQKKITPFKADLVSVLNGE
jgi:hypothetical protein